MQLILAIFNCLILAFPYDARDFDDLQVSTANLPNNTQFDQIKHPV